MQATAPGELRPVRQSWQPFQPCLLRRCDVNSFQPLIALAPQPSLSVNEGCIVRQQAVASTMALALRWCSLWHDSFNFNVEGLQLGQLQQMTDSILCCRPRCTPSLRRGAQLWQPWTRFRPSRRQPWPPSPPRTGADRVHITILDGGLITDIGWRSDHDFGWRCTSNACESTLSTRPKVHAPPPETAP